MDDSIPDPTDWLNTPLKDFAELESALHCQICKEFYDTPMITSCNHTFCSKCIRTSLSADGKCPACRAGDQASKIRNNWALQEVVEAFLRARPGALGVARGTRKRKRVVLDEEDGEEEGVRTTRSKSRRIAAQGSGSQAEAIEIKDSDEEYEDEEVEPTPQPADGRVECPLGCGKRMKEEEVFLHLDRCEDEQKQAARTKSRTTLNGYAQPSSQKGAGARPQERINELNYSMLKDAAFSKKLKEAGIPNWGSKQQMISRHKEWVNIWNANCDSTIPRTKREMLHDLDVWERTQGGKAPSANGPSSTIMRKDFDGGAYARKHQDEFSRLIADARRKKNMTATESAPTKDEVMSDEKAEEGEGEEESPFFTGDTKPYEDNPEAIAFIREKIQNINEGKQIEHLDAQHTTSSQHEGLPSMFHNTSISTNPADTTSNERPSSQDEHVTHARTGSSCDMPSHLQSSATQKLHMFEIPGQAVTDIDGGDAAAQ